MDREHWFVAIAAILYSTITVGGQFLVNLGLSLYEISLYSALFVCVIFLPIILIRPQYFIKKDYFWFFVIYGLINALLMLTQFGGIVFGIPVAIVVLLLYSQPIWTTIFGKLMLKEPITFGKIVAVCIVLFGVVILVKPWNLESVGTVAGFISALLGGLFLSLWIIWGRKSCITKQNSITTIIGWMGFTVIWLLVLWPFVDFFYSRTKRYSIIYKFSVAILVLFICVCPFSSCYSFFIFLQRHSKNFCINSWYYDAFRTRDSYNTCSNFIYSTHRSEYFFRGGSHNSLKLFGNS